MQKFYRVLAACALVLMSCQAAYASSEGGIPWGDFLLRVLTFACFFAIIWKCAGLLIKGFFKKRRAAIVQEMDGLAARRAEAEARLAEVERQIADVETECARLLEEGRIQVERMKDAILADAERQAARIVEQAAHVAEQEGKVELEAIRSRMAESVVSAVEKTLAETLDARAHQKLIDQSLTKVVLQ